VLAVLAAAALSLPAPYCSPSGDLCYAVVRRQGQIVLRIDTIERYFPRYTLCVTSPRGRRACGSFPIFRNRSLWTSAVRWQRQFPDHGPGRYRVSWRLGSRPLGPALTFRRS
jgi:hypothetical protein